MATTISITSGLTANPSKASNPSGSFTIVNNFTATISVDRGVGDITSGNSKPTTVSSGSVIYTASASGQSNVKFTLTKSKGDED